MAGLLTILVLGGTWSWPADFADQVVDSGADLVDRPCSGSLLCGAALSAAAFIIEPDGGCAGFMGQGLPEKLSREADPVFGPGAMAACPATWAAGAVSGSGSLEETGRDLTAGMFLTYAVVGAMKLGIERERPDRSDSMSFPSAHSASAACIAAVLWERYGPWAGIPAAAVASAVALSRIQIGEHYPSDVVAGLAIGAACGIAAARNGGRSDAAGGLLIGIEFRGGRAGVILR